MLLRPDAHAVETVVLAALREDAPWGDITSQAVLPVDAQLRAQLMAREDGVFCGEDLFASAMSLTGSVRTEFLKHDGEAISQGEIIARVEGPARAILQAERVALNFAQRLSGIASMTAKYVAETKGTKARIADTRKTTPGLRLFERYAVRCGGGHNHRFSLSDAVMVKDNHLAALARAYGADAPEKLRDALRELPHTTHIEIEVDRLDQIEMAIAAGAHTILLDNFTTSDLRTGVKQIGGRALVEASGGVTLGRIGEIAATGVDIISVGALTHSAPSLDLALDVAG